MKNKNRLSPVRQLRKKKQNQKVKKRPHQLMMRSQLRNNRTSRGSWEILQNQAKQQCLA